MKAFHGEISIKEKYLARVRSHKLADEIIKGVYWKNGKGCAIGCTIHAVNYEAYEVELDIPIILARLEDGIFEGLPDEISKSWPEKFLEAINVGADLSAIYPKFATWLLTDKDHGVIKFAKTAAEKKVIRKISELFKRYLSATEKEWKEAVLDSARVWAEKGLYSSAVYLAAVSMLYDSSVEGADAAFVAACDSYSSEKTRMIQADKLLELLKECA